MAVQAAEVPPAWEHFPHDADIGVRGSGSSLAEAFENAARALTAVVVPLDSVAAETPVALTCTAPDDDVLLVDWLNAIIFEMATRHMLFRDFEVEIHKGALTGRAIGEPVDIVRHTPAVEPKGATFTALKVGQDAKGHWTVQCIIDV